MSLKYLNVWKIIGISRLCSKVLSSKAKTKKSRAIQSTVTEI